MAQLRFQASYYLAAVFERVGVLDAKLEGECGDGHGKGEPD